MIVTDADFAFARTNFLILIPLANPFFWNALCPRHAATRCWGALKPKTAWVFDAKKPNHHCFSSIVANLCPQMKDCAHKVNCPDEPPISAVVKEHPETIPVFMKHGLHCIGCAVAAFESIEEGATVHGIDVDALVTDLNTAVASGRPD